MIALLVHKITVDPIRDEDREITQEDRDWAFIEDHCEHDVWCKLDIHKISVV